MSVDSSYANEDAFSLKFPKSEPKIKKEEAVEAPFSFAPSPKSSEQVKISFDTPSEAPKTVSAIFGEPKNEKTPTYVNEIKENIPVSLKNIDIKV